MNATKQFDIEKNRKLSVDTDGLQAILGCGRKSAVQIGELAEAKIRIGKRVFWNVEKVKLYLNDISE